MPQSPFHNINFVMHEVELQETPLFQAAEPVKAGKIPVEGKGQKPLDIAPVQHGVVKTGKYTGIGGLLLQIIGGAVNVLQGSHFTKLFFCEKAAFHGSYFCGNSTVGQQTHSYSFIMD